MADFNLQEEFTTLQASAPDYPIPNEIDISSMDAGSITSALEGAIESTAINSESITEPETFDVFRSLLKYADSLPAGLPPKLLDSISSGLLAEYDAAQRDLDADDTHAFKAHKLPLEMYVFLIMWFVSAVEKAPSVGRAEDQVKGRKGKGTAAAKTAKSRKAVDWTWVDQIQPTLALLAKVLRLKTHRIWTTTAEKDAFINCLTRPAYFVTESESYMKVEKIRIAVYKVICTAVKSHGHTLGAQISIMQSLQYYEHLSEPMAEMLHVLDAEMDHQQLADEILQEIGMKKFIGQDTKGPRSFSKFLVRFAELSPRLVIKKLVVLFNHLDCEAYPMRIAMVEVIGFLIKDIATTDDEKKDKKISSLFDVLIERLLDVNSYVRAKVIQTLVKLCDLPQKFPKQRLVISTQTVASLEDKSSSVRRSSIALLTKLVLTHPYGHMHGGLLNLAEWDERYKGAKEELAKAQGQGIGIMEGEDAEESEEEEEEEGEDDEDMFRRKPQEPGERDQEDEEDEALGHVEWSARKSVTSTVRKGVASTAKKTVRSSARKSRAGSEFPSSEGDDPDATLPGMDDIDDLLGEDDDAQPAGDDEGFEEGQEDEQVPADDDDDDVYQGDDMEATPRRREPKTPAKTPKTPKNKDPKTPRNKDPKTPKNRAMATLEDVEGTAKPKKKKKKSLDPTAALANAHVAVSELQSHEIVQLKLRRHYYAEALEFIKGIEAAGDILVKLLGSTNKSEVLEVMEFFRVGWEYGLTCAKTGIKHMLHLIWTKDNSTSTSAAAQAAQAGPAAGDEGKELKGIRSRLLECYRSIYFEPLEGLDAKQQVNRVSKNMIELTYNATLADLTSLEEMIRTMMDDGQIPGPVLSKLWQVYSTDKDIPKMQRRGAIIILGMAAAAKRQVVTDRVDTLLRVGLGPLGKADLVLARYTCKALQRLSGSVKKVKGSLADKSVRLPMDNPIFAKLEAIIEHQCMTKDWFSLTEQAINAIYLLGEQPDLLCDKLIRTFAHRAFAQPTRQSPPPTQSQDPFESGLQPPAEDGDMGESFHLSQLLFIVGHVAIKHIVYLELVERELKRRKDVSDKEKRRPTSTSPTKSVKEGEELDQVAGNAEDEIGDLVISIREEEMLYSPYSLLTDFGDLVVHICASRKLYKNQCLRTTATLTLCKLMCVSSKFCEANLLLLLKVLETSNDPTIRSNIVIALGDIAVCFSTLIDENSDRLYKGLSDPDLVVKKNTLMVLTHLILNGMIKVKGQLGEMAKCLEDEEMRIADLAKLFFTELSTKDNAIYNNIQDVISHLSIGPHAVDEEVFQNTMKYIFSFIEKEKQAESLVEKLCQRFRDAEDEKQWRNTAYCLSLLPFKSDKSLKKLIDGLPFYQDKLREETVYARFSEILAKARLNKSANKPDSEMKEFEQILLEHKEQGEEDQALEKRARVKKAQAKKRASRRKKPVEGEEE